MQVFRLIRKKYGLELSGKGAAKSGNRWNSKGTEIIYCAQSRALALAELAVHISLAMVPKDFVMLEVNIPTSISRKSISISKLPFGWNEHPPILDTQRIGDDFIQNNKFCVLKVPSAVVHGDFNYLVNPFHTSFSKISINSMSEFPIDDRLLT